MFKIKGESFFWKRFAFFLRLVFFSECFQTKYSQNLLGAKHDSTMVTFNSCTDTRQISTAPNSRRYLIRRVVPFWKMMSFETIRFRFLVQNRSAFCLVRVLPQKQCGMQTRHIILRQRDTGYVMILHFH